MKRFLVQFALFAAIQAVILGVFFGVYFGLPFENDPMAAIADKEKLLKETPSPRLIVVGDSGVPFGIVSPELAKAFPDRHPVNAGLAAGFGHRVLLGEVEPEIREGDVIIVCFVYEMFARNLLNNFFFLLSGQDPDVYLSLDKEDYGFIGDNAALLVKNAMHHARKVAFNPIDRSYPDPYARTSYNAYGDIDAHWKLDYPSERNRNLEELDLGDLEYANEVIEDINEFAAIAEERGAKVYFLFPDVTEKSYADFGDEMNRLAAKLEAELNVPLLNRPADAVQVEAHFYDTPYHLMQAGAEDRTARLIAALKREGVQ